MKKSKVPNDTLLRLRAEKFTVDQIAEQVGLTPHTVSYRLNNADRMAQFRREEQGMTSESERYPAGALQNGDKTLVELDFSVRTMNCLLNHLPWAVKQYEADEITVDMLCQNTPAELIQLPNFGRRSLAEVVETLAFLDRHLGDTQKPPPAPPPSPPRPDPPPVADQRNVFQQSLEVTETVAAQKKGALVHWLQSPDFNDYELLRRTMNEWIDHRKATDILRIYADMLKQK